MRRVVGTAIGLVVIVLAVFIPAAVFDFGGGGEENYEETTITRYDADFDVAADGTMSVTERLTVDFPSYGKHGIFRFWDVADPNASNLRREPEDIAVTLDGKPEEFEELTEDNGRYHVAKIGSAYRTLDPGEHVYVITYVIRDAIIEGADGHESQFYWNLIPGGWQQRILEADLTVSLPVEAQDVECAVGTGETGGCTADGEGTTDLRVRTGPIDARTPVTIRTGLDMATPDVEGKSLPWSVRFDPVLGGSLVLLVLVVLLAFGALAWGSVIGARSREPKPAYPLMYAPPDGIGPAQGSYLLTETVDKEAFVASVLEAAEQDAVTLDRQGAAWTITDKGGAEAWAKLDEVTTQVARLLHGPGTSFVADPNDVEAGKRLKTRLSDFESSTKSWAEGKGLMVPSGLGSIGGFVVMAGFAAVVAVLIWNPVGMTAIGLIPGFFAVGAVSLLRSGSGTRRTAAGRELWSRLGGFHRVLSTPSSEQRFDFSGRQELYTKYIPWAVAFGVADQWAEKYRTEMGAEPPTPRYLGSAYTGSVLGTGITQMVDSFSGTLDSAISSYEATQKSSSSGGGGGGFSGGGGGGGGGGGSW
jgi:uncharacterized membrane protein YgcG